MAYHLSRVNPLPVWDNFSDPNLLSLLLMIDSGALISDSMMIPCYDKKTINFLEETNNCFKSDTYLKSNNVNYFLFLFLLYLDNVLVFYCNIIIFIFRLNQILDYYHQNLKLILHFIQITYYL